MENQENLSTDELYNLGEKYYKEKNYEEAVKYWEKAAMMGNSSARSSLSFCYKTGTGVEKDEVKADYWYKQSVSMEKLKPDKNEIFRDILNNKFISLKNSLLLFKIGLYIIGIRALICFITRISPIKFSERVLYIILYNLVYISVIISIIIVAIKIINKLYKGINISVANYKKSRILLFISMILIGLHFCIESFFGIEILNNYLNNSFIQHDYIIFGNFVNNETNNSQWFLLLALIIGVLLTMTLPIYLLIKTSKNKKIKIVSISLITILLIPFIYLFISNKMSNSMMISVFQLDYIGDTTTATETTMKIFVTRGFPFIDFVYLGINIFIIILLNSMKNKLTNK